MNMFFNFSLLILGVITSTILAIEDGKSSQRDINDVAETVDFMNKIPFYVLPNEANGAGVGTESKIPVAVISGAYSPAYFNTAPLKDTKQYPKYSFYSPHHAYKFPSKATPIHEPSPDEETPPATYGTQAQYVYRYQPKSEYDLSYKPPNESTYTASSFATLKPLLPKHQAISNNNAYASLVPSYANVDTSAAVNYPTPTNKKYATYDAENNVQIQYVLKYVPVPYEVPATSAGHQQYTPNAAAVTYITPKPYYYNKESPKRPQAVHAATPLNYPAASTHQSYAVESYAPLFDELNQPLPSFKQIQPATSSPSFVPSASYKNQHEKLAKKYVPTSYVLATIGGKNSPTHYAATIKHDSTSSIAASADSAAHTYATKLVSIPLPVEKYVTANENKLSAPAADQKTTAGGDFSYVIATNYPSGKYKQSLMHASPSNEPDSAAIYEYANTAQYQYQDGYYKKDVSHSLNRRGTNSPKEAR